MEQPPYIDIHTHDTTRRPGVMAVVDAGLRDIPEAAIISAGVHPWVAVGYDEDALAARIGSDKRIVAVGETGLDFYDEAADRQLQERVFVAQLRLARRHGLPVMVHCVKAYNRLIEIVRQEKPERMVIHNFISSEQMAAQLIALGACLSMGMRGMASEKGREVLKTIPLTSLFLETDESGTSIEEVYARAAEIKGLPLQQLKDALYENFKKLVLYGMA